MNNLNMIWKNHCKCGQKVTTSKTCAFCYHSLCENCGEEENEKIVCSDCKSTCYYCGIPKQPIFDWVGEEKEIIDYFPCLCKHEPVS